MSFRQCIHVGNFCRALFSILVGWLIIMASRTVSQAKIVTLNVTNFGAIGDCSNIVVNVTSNSDIVTTTSSFSSADVGKVMCLFGAGYYATLLSSGGIFGGNYHGTPTNHQDMVVTILSVDGTGTNITISSPCGVTSNNIPCTYGTQNMNAFSNCIAAATDPCTIYIPTGNYLLIPPTALDTNYIQTYYYTRGVVFNISKGGITFLGDGTNLTILTGNGAWQQKGEDYAYRGSLISMTGPFTASADPLIFDGIQFNGNAVRNHSPYTYFPAVPTDGTGWDNSHNCFLYAGTDPFPDYISYTNCLFTHWHGETIYEQLSATNGFIDVGNCVFVDGNATALNVAFSHNYHNNLFDDYNEVEENYEGYATAPSYFENNLVTNMFGALMAINGALSNQVNQPYNIIGNTFYCPSGNGIQTTPAQNVYIISNQFIGDNSGSAIDLGVAGYQGSTINSNIVVADNLFSNVYYAVAVEGAGQNAVWNVLVTNNVAINAHTFAYGYGWSTNVVFKNNAGITGCLYGLDSSSLLGQMFIDDASNVFPTNEVNPTGNNTTNTITYAKFGQRHSVSMPYTNDVLSLDDTQPSRVPSGAVLNIYYLDNYGTKSVSLYPSASLSGSPITFTNGESLTFYWNGFTWTTNVAVDPPPPPLPAPIILSINLK
jgi:hypothetical protein